MGNHYRFVLSEVVPDQSWFSKLKSKTRSAKKHDMINKDDTVYGSIQRDIPTSQNPPNPFYYSPPRKSQYFTRALDPPPETSSCKHTPRAKTTTASHRRVSSTVSSGCSSRNSSPSEPHSPELRSDLVPASFDEAVSWSTSPCKVKEGNPSNGVVSYPFAEIIPAGLALRPIITKPQKFNETVKIAKKKQLSHKRKSGESNSNSDGSASGEKKIASYVRKSSPNISHGVRLRPTSSRLACRKWVSRRKSVSSSRSSLSDSLAVVKFSLDPHSDFRESMVEMIVENNIWDSEDLEDLLACYISLNSDEYHDLIIKVFKQIWVDLLKLRLN